jgi:hypothetical protein
MILWIACYLLGFLTVAFAPFLIGVMVSILSSVGKKAPALADAGAIITVTIVGLVFALMSAVFAKVYHYVFTGVP